MSGKVYSIPGGLHPADHKAESNGKAIIVAPLSSRYVIPLRQHIGQPARALVHVGDAVLKGQMIGCLEGYISSAVHAPTSGRVIAIEARSVAHPSGLPDQCIVIEPDGEDTAVEMKPIAWRELPPGELHKHLANMGLAGQGGAVFPSHVKLNPGKTAIETLILNGAECEPWITCDDRLMRERATEIMQGAEIIRHALGAKRILVGIEDNKPEAAQAMQAAGERLKLAAEVGVVPTRYPSGGAKQLTQLLTGLETPSGKISTDIGIQVFNVATAYALYRAVELGEPMVSRIVTITGNVAEPCNIEARLGTPIEDLIRLAGGDLTHTTGHLIGGPMMGFDLSNTAAPLVKSVNCVIAKNPALFPPHPQAMPCIRCGQCTLACPASLQPFELYWHSKSKDFDKANAYNLFDCIECGCCSHVCPSHIPLVDYYRFAKSEIAAANRAKQASEIAGRRHEFQLLRIEREKKEKAERLAKKTSESLKAATTATDDPDAASKKAMLDAAIERAKQAKASAQPMNTEQLTPEQQHQVAEIEARRNATQQDTEQKA
jgi:electron transport complex protein RnfC